MNPSTFDDLVQFLIDEDRPHYTGRKPIDFRKRLAMTLVFCGCSLPTYHCAQLFGVSGEAFLRQTTNMMNYLI